MIVKFCKIMNLKIINILYFISWANVCLFAHKSLFFLLELMLPNQCSCFVFVMNLLVWLFSRDKMMFV